MNTAARSPCILPARKIADHTETFVVFIETNTSKRASSCRRLHVSTGAEIETALCILESVVPRRWYALGISTLGNLWVPHLLRPKSGVLGNSETRNLGVSWARTQEGSSETRKLGIWKLGVPWARTQEGPSETRKLGIWNLGILWAWTQEGPSETRKLGIWNLVVLQTGPRGGLGKSETRNLEFA